MRSSKLLNPAAAAAGHDDFHLKQYKRGRSPKIALKPTEIDAILDQYKASCTEYQFRDLAIACVAMLLGARRSEVSRLRLRDLDPDRSAVFVRAAKNYVDEWIPVEQELWPYVQDWLDVRQGSSDALFTHLKAPFKPLAPPGVYGVLQRIGKAVGIPGLNTNKTRHTRGKRLKQSRAPREDRKFLLRHTSEDVMATYEETEFEDAQRSIQDFGPGLRGDPAAAGDICPTCKRPF